MLKMISTFKVETCDHNCVERNTELMCMMKNKDNSLIPEFSGIT